MGLNGYANLHEFKEGVIPLYTTRCKFGTGSQDMKTCKMIYIHIQGYYPTEEAYQFALRHLCPNYKGGSNGSSG